MSSHVVPVFRRLQAGGNDGVQTPFGSILEKIRQEEADEGLLQGCEWPQQEPIWQSASDAVVWRNGDALVRFLVNKRLKGPFTLRESVFFRAELPTLARYPPKEGVRVLNEHPDVKCHHLMPVIRDKIESSGLLDGWRKVKTFSCVDITSQEARMNPSESAYKQLDGKATEFLKPGEQLDPECGVETLTFESYQSCRGRGQIDFKLFQRVARELPPEYIPEFNSLRLQKLSHDIAQLPILLPDIVEMFDSSISLELCLWSSVPQLKMPDIHGLNASDFCRRGANKLLPELRKALSGHSLHTAEGEALAHVFQEAPEAVLPELRTALGDSSKWVRSRAADLLKSAGKRARAAVPELRKNLGSAFGNSPAAEALKAIGKEAPDAVLPELQKALGDSDSEVRSDAAEALGSFGKMARAAVPELRKALGDSDRTVRRNAAEALTAIGKEAPETVLPELQNALGDSHVHVFMSARVSLRLWGSLAGTRHGYFLEGTRKTAKRHLKPCCRSSAKL